MSTETTDLRDRKLELVAGLNPPALRDAQITELEAAKDELVAMLKHVLPYCLMGGSGYAQHEFKAPIRALIAKHERTRGNGA